VPLGTRTYPLATSRSIAPVNHWTVGGVADSLENRCFSCICSSNNEDSELEITGKSGENILFSGHSTKCVRSESSQGA
jgi:hypothetical protein